MAYLKKLLGNFRIVGDSTRPADEGRKTNEVMGEFLDSFGPTEDAPTEDSVILEELADIDREDENVDPFSGTGWGEKK